MGHEAPAILNDLQQFLRTNTGCRTAKSKMIDIYKQLYSIGKGDRFEDFIRRRFPYIIEEDRKTRTNMPQRLKAKKPVTMRPRDKHGVFKRYKPELLSFPQKLILVEEDSEALLRMVKDFLKDKVEIDYLIMGDTAYIEYVLKKYEDVVNQIPDHAKEIHQFRLRMSQK